MAAKQFSQVVFRALAIYVLILSLGQINQLVMLYTGMNGAPPEFDFRPSQKFAATAVWTLQVLIAAFLWTNADKFVSGQPDSQPTLRAGNWVVRLVFTAIGALICVYALDSIVLEAANLIVPDPMRRDRSRDMILALVIDGIRFMIGLVLIVVYRFDKPAAVSAASAVDSHQLSSEQTPPAY